MKQTTKAGSSNKTCLPIKSIMTTDVITVHPEMLIFDAIQLLPKYKVSGLPVVDVENRLVGILTEKDVLKILTKSRINYHDTVAQYMTKDVVAFAETDSAITVSKFFETNPIRRVPIVRDGKLIGVVSRRDIIRLILEAKSHLSAYRFS